MKAHLMHKGRDFDLQQALPPNAQNLIQDLELDTLFNAMALEDSFLSQVAKQAILSGLSNDAATIRYRQAVLQDCLRHPAVIREMYHLTVETIISERKNYWGLSSKYPDAILRRSIEVMQLFVGTLKKLRQIAVEHGEQFESEGVTAFFAMLKQELGDDFFARVGDHLRELQFRGGVLISAELGIGNKGRNFVLRKSPQVSRNWLQRLLPAKPSGYTFQIADRDESGARALADLGNRGVNLAANALAQSNDHILGFLKSLQTELAFYVGCLNLYDRLAQKGEPTSFPVPHEQGLCQHSFHGLYDVCLTLHLPDRVVANDVNADSKNPVIITGANQGGKSTFLRSIGLAQLMMQCGMFVPAGSFRGDVCDALFTHYKRQEDTTMTSGKLDEELARMSEIVDHLTANSLVLFNESFAATNEREGSEIARQIVSALLAQNARVFFVTHLYEFARSFYDKKRKDALFLRAERQPDGSRTFKLTEGEPLETSYGVDLYDKIFRDRTVQAVEAGAPAETQRERNG